MFLVSPALGGKLKEEETCIVNTMFILCAQPMFLKGDDFGTKPWVTHFKNLLKYLLSSEFLPSREKDSI